MRHTIRLATALTAFSMVAVPAAARQAPSDSQLPVTAPVAIAAPPLTPVTAAAEPTAAEAAAVEAEASWKKGRAPRIQYLRPQDKRGLNVFETTKVPGVEFTGFKLDFGAAFTSQIQNLSHSNTAVPVMVNGVNTNRLADIGLGFNTSTANVNVHAQLAPGIRVQLTSYLSSRHHNETWVKDGFIQIDESPIDFAPLKMLLA
ncbi:MAG: hypothetical protein ABIQ52_07215, partial [Vicinamibacterales bacterium]